MKTPCKFLIWIVALQIIAIASGLVMLTLNNRWISKAKETSITLQNADATLDTLTAKLVASTELGECKHFGTALANFGKSASISLKADNASNQAFIQSMQAMLWIIIGSVVVSLGLVVRCHAKLRISTDQNGEAG